MVVNVFSLDHVMLEPVVPLLVHVLDEQRIEGVDVANQHVPLLLQLGLHLTRVLRARLEEPSQVVLLLEHVVGPLANALRQREVRVLEEVLARVDDDLLRVAGDTRHPRGVLEPDVVQDQAKDQAQKCVHVLARYHGNVISVGIHFYRIQRKFFNKERNGF